MCQLSLEYAKNAIGDLENAPGAYMQFSEERLNYLKRYQKGEIGGIYLQRIKFQLWGEHINQVVEKLVFIVDFLIRNHHQHW